MSPRHQPLSRAFELNSFKLDHALWFRLAAPPGVESLPSDEIGVPVAICYRIFHLGSAYDGQIVKYLQPSGSVSIPYLEIQRLVSELEVVEKVTTDWS